MRSPPPPPNPEPGAGTARGEPCLSHSLQLCQGSLLNPFDRWKRSLTPPLVLRSPRRRSLLGHGFREVLASLAPTSGDRGPRRHGGEPGGRGRGMAPRRASFGASRVALPVSNTANCAHSAKGARGHARSRASVKTLLAGEEAGPRNPRASDADPASVSSPVKWAAKAAEGASLRSIPTGLRLRAGS